MELKQIDLNKIVTSKFQSRKEFDKEKIKELAESADHNELLQPILVRHVGSKYEIIAGERRYRAFKYLKKNKIYALIKNIKDDHEMLEKSLIENMHRADLTSVERENAVYNLWKSGKYKSKRELGRKLGMNEDSINPLIEAKEYRDKEKPSRTVSTHTIRVTKGLDNKSRRDFLKKAEKENIGGMKTEEYVKTIKKVPSSIKDAIIKDDMDLEVAEEFKDIKEKDVEPILKEVKKADYLSNDAKKLLIRREKAMRESPLEITPFKHKEVDVKDVLHKLKGNFITGRGFITTGILLNKYFMKEGNLRFFNKVQRNEILLYMNTDLSEIKKYMSILERCIKKFNEMKR